MSFFVPAGSLESFQSQLLCALYFDDKSNLSRRKDFKTLISVIVFPLIIHSSLWFSVLHQKPYTGNVLSAIPLHC